MEQKSSTNWYQGCGTKVEGQDADKQAYLEKIERSGRFIVQPKCDGNWGSIHGGKNLKVISRGGLSIDNHGLHPFPEGCLVIGEMARGTQEALKRKTEHGCDFVDVFDILFFNHKWLGDLPLLDRLKALAEWHDKLWDKAKPSYKLLPVWTKDFVSRYEAEVEGLVIKPLANGGYRPGTKPKDWVKAKKEYTWDMVIMDWVRSTSETKSDVPHVESLIVGQYVNGLLSKMAKVGSMTNELSKAIAANFNKYKGRVVEVKGFARFNSGNLRHPSLVSDRNPLRTDKSPEECIWDGTTLVGTPW
jgi:hypothetical protein|tara:strand:- start:3263 stop:4168 length:906 start_codon:yes stop_codon:yes gene_type:complete